LNAPKYIFIRMYYSTKYFLASEHVTTVRILIQCSPINSVSRRRYLLLRYKVYNFENYQGTLLKTKLEIEKSILANRCIYYDVVIYFIIVGKHISLFIAGWGFSGVWLTAGALQKNSVVECFIFNRVTITNN
jgi:hypothetical protein